MAATVWRERRNVRDGARDTCQAGAGAVPLPAAGAMKSVPSGTMRQARRSIRPARFPVGFPSSMNTAPLTNVQS